MKTCKDCGNPTSRKGSYCRRCEHKRYVSRDPARAAYLRLKRGAKSRGISFSLTLPEFKKFCVEYDYLNKKGIYAKCLHIDRIDPLKGYHADNIQLLTNSQNVRKYIEFKSKNNFTVRTFIDPLTDESNCPF